MNKAPSIAIIGSVNLDIVATGPALPRPGETVTGAVLARYPGGKGANQALAAQRLGARATLIAQVGADAEAEQALRLLQEGGVDLSRVVIDTLAATGVALIAVSVDGENQIIVAPGANARLAPGALTLPETDAVICQLEIPIDTVAKAARTKAFFCLNAAPAKSLPGALLDAADLLVVNQTEAAFYGATVAARRGLTAVTYGGDGAALFKDGEQIARTPAPRVEIVDTTGAGDAFTAGLTLALVEGRPPEPALAFACAAGAFAASRSGAQPSLPNAHEVLTLL